MFLKWKVRRFQWVGVPVAFLTLTALYFLFYPMERDTIECFDDKLIGGLQDILEDESQPPVKGKSIFFHETSCHKASSPIIHISPRQACAVESAALTNPNMTVYLLFASPVLYFNSSSFPSQSIKIMNVLIKYPNIKIRRVDLSTYTKDTPLEEWYKTGILQNSKYPNSHASDVLRFLSLWKYGGTYLDLDVVVMKNLNDLNVNYAAAESKTSVAAGVLSFDHQGFGHEVASECIREIKNNFKGEDWGYNGPGVITRVLKNICRTRRVIDMTIQRCKGFNVLPPSTFYPVPWNKWVLYFDYTKFNMAMDMIKSSYAIHVWNKFSVKISIHKGSAQVAYGAIAEQYCPNVYRESGIRF